MKASLLLSALVAGPFAAALSADRLMQGMLRGPSDGYGTDLKPARSLHRRREENQVDRADYGGGKRFLNRQTAPFAVNGSAIPDVDFDVGESYAGLLPISEDADEQSDLFFWFFPTVNQEHLTDKEIVIWMNGGPGCSSLLGLLQENGPFQWQPGMPKIARNPWSWHLLTNVVYIEHPVGTGFSKGNASVRNEDDVARQFLGFWSNFVKTFGMSGWRVYVVAESYGGYYGPYIGSLMLDAKDEKRHGKLGGLMVYDGLMFDGLVQAGVVLEAFMDQNRDLMPLDDRMMAHVRNVSVSCGFRDWHHRYLRYPAVPGPLPPAPGYRKLGNGTVVARPECEGLFNQIFDAMQVVNPCFNIYNIRDQCPKPRDPLGAQEKTPYFDRSDVKKAINAPVDVPWKQCVDNIFKAGDGSPPPDAYQLPNIVDQTHNVILAHGAMDFILPLNGILLGLQNMTWGGKRGFDKAPRDPFYVPLYGYSSRQGAHYYADWLPAGSGVQGTTHSERGLTLVVTQLAGHEGPGYAPAAAMRQLEALLGRVNGLSGRRAFTLPELRGVKQVKGKLGRGTVRIPCLGKGC